MLFLIRHNHYKRPFSSRQKMQQSFLHCHSYYRTHWISAPTLAAAAYNEQEEISWTTLIYVRIESNLYRYFRFAVVIVGLGLGVERKKKRLENCPHLVDLTPISKEIRELSPRFGHRTRSRRRNTALTEKSVPIIDREIDILPNHKIRVRIIHDDKLP